MSKQHLGSVRQLAQVPCPTFLVGAIQVGLASSASFPPLGRCPSGLVLWEDELR